MSNSILLSVALTITVLTLSCGKKYNCNCTSYTKGSTTIVDKKDMGMRAKSSVFNDADWNEGCRKNGHLIDSNNNFSTTTECVPF